MNATSTPTCIWPAQRPCLPPTPRISAWPRMPIMTRRRSVDGVGAAGVEVGVAVLADDVAVVHDVVALAVRGGDDADAVERLGEVRQHVRDAVAAAQVAALATRGGTRS